MITDNPDGTPFTRLAFNFGHNFLLLLIMALGPAGALFVGLGLSRRGPVTVLMAGVALQLGLTLLHDDTGIHTVGPIHFSEALPSLVLLATAGVLIFVTTLRRYRIPQQLPVMAVGAYILGGLALFSIVHSYGLRIQAANSQVIYEAVRTADLRNAVVVGERPQVLIHSHPVFRQTGSWVHWFPPPDPYFRDEIIYAYADAADLDAIRRRFPDRQFYRMTYHHDGSPVRIAALE